MAAVLAGAGKGMRKVDRRVSGMIFDANAADKAARTLEFLEALYSHSQAKGRICLHGGTALNLFVLTPERLSLDADVNYVGDCESDAMPPIRAALEDAVEAVAKELGYVPRAGKGGHAGRTFKFVYVSAMTGSPDFIKMDIDYMNRVPIVPPIMAKSKLDDPIVEFPINAPAEIVASKLKAMCERVVPRDLYDVGRIGATRDEWTTGSDSADHALMIFYYALSSSFPKPQDILGRFDGRERDVETILWPVLPAAIRPTLSELKADASAFVDWATAPQNDNEAEFLALLSTGDYRPELLFGPGSDALQNAIASPAMRWKLRNLRTGIEKGLVEPLRFG